MSDSYFNTFSIRVGGEEVMSQLQVLTESRVNQKQAVDENYLIDKNTETLEALTTQYNILDRDQ